MQLELVLLVFLRLAEDVILALDPNLQSQRRKNIEQALSENVKDLFIFLITNLQTHVGLWRKNVNVIPFVLLTKTSKCSLIGESS